MSRILVNFTSNEPVKPDFFDKHYVQSMIYSTLYDAGYRDIHIGNKFRYFSFSDFYPSGPMQRNENKSFLISSPAVNIIRSLKNLFEERWFFFLGNHRFTIEKIKMIDIRRPIKRYRTGSPVILYKESRRNIYFSLRRGDGLAFFFRRIKENAIKRYRQFSGDREYDLPFPIFDSMEFKKEISVHIKRGRTNFQIIGTMWENMERFVLRRRDEPFYRFILDAGIGEKPSLGFGFLNPVKEVN